MSWKCPKCNSENADYIIEGLEKTECLCGYKLSEREQKVVDAIKAKGIMPTEEAFKAFQQKQKMTDRQIERIKNAVGRTGANGYMTGKKEGDKKMEKNKVAETATKSSSIIPAFIDNYLDELSIKLNHSQKIIIGIAVAAIFFVIAMAIADIVGTSCGGRRVQR